MLSQKSEPLSSVQWKPKILLKMTVILTVIHIGMIYGTFLIMTARVCWLTGLWAFIVYGLGGIGTGIGSHRLFSHRSFKATRPLKLFLLFCQTLSGQLSVHSWVRTHRAHHKFNDTNSDPSNINRGFFFAYVGNYCLSRHPDCQKEWERIDMRDIDNDKDLSFQNENYGLLWALLPIGLSTITPVIFWKESLWIAFWMNVFRTYFNVAHVGFSNSFNHLFGSRSYDKSITATDNFFINIFMFGEGNHNYHHTFPQDYKGAEHGDLRHFNILTMMIHAFEMCGLAYDLKSVSTEMVIKRQIRTGDEAERKPNI